jgi:uncharacterized cupin superfamily protein
MAERRWSTARLSDITPDHEPSFWDEWARAPGFGARWHSIGTHFGITAFGIAANEADAGEELIVPHDETTFGGQEELYVVVRGRARFVCDRHAVELGEGEALHVTAEVQREAVALVPSTLLLMVGGIPGKPYERGW